MMLLRLLPSAAVARAPAETSPTASGALPIVEAPPSVGDLLTRVAIGDRTAMQECIARYGGLVFALARRASGSQEEAEDAAQEIFLDLWRSAGRFDARVASEITFVAMVSRRRLSDRVRARRRRMASEPMMSPAPESNTWSPALGERCAEAALAVRALEKLPPEQREVLLLSTVDELSHEEIARHKGLPLGTVKSHVRRALSKVRATLLGEVSEETS